MLWLGQVPGARPGSGGMWTVLEAESWPILGGHRCAHNRARVAPERHPSGARAAPGRARGAPELRESGARAASRLSNSENTCHANSTQYTGARSGRLSERRCGRGVHRAVLKMACGWSSLGGRRRRFTRWIAAGEAIAMRCQPRSGATLVMPWTAGAERGQSQRCPPVRRRGTAARHVGIIVCGNLMGSGPPTSASRTSEPEHLSTTPPRASGAHFRADFGLIKLRVCHGRPPSSTGSSERAMPPAHTHMCV